MNEVQRTNPYKNNTPGNNGYVLECMKGVSGICSGLSALPELCMVPGLDKLILGLEDAL